ncbi:MAG: hypothetical protein U9O59_04880 [Actinomycetota bacterium]|nr:hypothetical protein [Actinomycetota bacterium]
MVVIPDPILLQRFNNGLIRGNVIRTRNLPNLPPEMFKRIILLNNDFDNAKIYYCFTTSEVEWYIDNWSSDKVCENCIYCLKGETSNNLTEDMVINLREVNDIDKETLFENYKNKILDFLNPFSVEIMSQVDSIIKDSRLIPPKYIRKIL